MVLTEALWTSALLPLRGRIARCLRNGMTKMETVQRLEGEFHPADDERPYRKVEEVFRERRKRAEIQTPGSQRYGHDCRIMCEDLEVMTSYVMSRKLQLGYSTVVLRGSFRQVQTIGQSLLQPARPTARFSYLTCLLFVRSDVCIIKTFNVEYHCHALKASIH